MSEHKKAAPQGSGTANVGEDAFSMIQRKGTDFSVDSQESKRKIAARCIELMNGCSTLAFRTMPEELDGQAWYIDTPICSNIFADLEVMEWRSSGDKGHGFLFVPLSRPVADPEHIAKGMKTRGLRVQQREAPETLMRWLMEREPRIIDGLPLEPPAGTTPLVDGVVSQQLVDGVASQQLVEYGAGAEPPLEVVMPDGDLAADPCSQDGEPVAVASDKVVSFPSDSIPIWVLPERLQHIIKEVCKNIDAPRDFATACMFSAAGTALGNKVTSRFGEFSNRPNMWFALVGESGIANKTQTISAFYDCIRAIDTEETSEYNKRVYDWKLEQAARASKKGKGQLVGDDDITISSKPRNNTMLMDDTTDDKITRRLCESDAVTWDADELSAVFGTMGRHTKNGSTKVAEKNLMKGFDGTRLKQERVSEDYVLQAQKPCLSIIGGIQPEVLVDTLKGANFTRDGLFQRFVYVYPDREWADEYFIPKDITRAKTEWCGIVRELREIQPTVLTETSEAYELHRGALTKWQRLQRDSYSDFPAMRSLIQKMGYHLCRWSIIAAILAGKMRIDGKVMRYSIECCDVFIKYGERALRLVTEPPKPKKMTLKELVIALDGVAPINNQAMFAKSIGKSKQSINTILAGRGQK